MSHDNPRDHKSHAHQIERELEHRLKSSHSADRILHNEVHRLRTLDSHHGKLNEKQFKSDLKELNHYLEKKHLLPHLQLVTSGKHAGEILRDLGHAHKCDHASKEYHLHKGGRIHPEAHPHARNHPGAGEKSHSETHPHAGAHPHHPDHLQKENHLHKGKHSHSGGKLHSSGIDHSSVPAGSEAGPAAQYAPAEEGGSPNYVGQAIARSENGLALVPRTIDTSFGAPSNPEGFGDSGLTSLRAAVERAKAGGRPVNIAQIGDSHIAPGTETAALAQKFAANQGLNAGQVEYTSRGVVGKSASDAAAHPQEFLGKLNSHTDLVVVSFGSNEATKQVGNGYKNDYAHLIQQVRQRAPNASILMVGPTDGAYWNSRRELPGLGSVTEAQRAVQARTPNSAYVDIRSLTGSMASMRSRGMLSNDNLHLTHAGYRVAGGIIADSISSTV